jgi:outer membrane protein
MLLKRIVFLLLISSSSLFAQEKKWTLEECVNYALENNVSIQQSLLDWESSKIDKLEAIGNFLPNLNASSSYNINTGANINPTTNQFENSTFKSFSANANSSMNLFSGFANWKTLQRSKLNALATQYRLDKMKDDIALNVANSYLQILLQKEQIKVLKNQLEVSLENKTRTSDLIEAGQIPAGDIFEIEATIASQEQQLITAQNNELFAKLGLAQLLLIEDYANFDIVDETFTPELSQVYAQTPEAIFEASKGIVKDIKVAQSNYDLSKKDLSIARSAYFPRLSGFVGYNTRWSESQILTFNEQLYLLDGTAIGLQLQVPIFNGFSTRASVKRAKINLKRNEFLVKQSELDLERNVFQAYNDAINAQKTYLAAQKTVDARKQSFEFSKERYDVGLMNSFDYMQAKNNFENAEADLIRAKYDYIFKTKILEFYFGIPLIQNN